MSQTVYRRRAILARIRQALDAFYLLQKIDWEYDIRSTLEKILALGLEEIEFEGGRQIERGLIIIQPADGGELEIHAGWKADEPDLVFSRTVVQQTIATGEAILCENAKDDPRFMEAESIKNLETLSLISVPLRFEVERIGALYIESKSPRNLFNEIDLEFLREFTDIIAPYLKTAMTHRDHLKEIRRLQEEVSDHYSFSNIIGRSASMQGVFDLVRIAAEVDRTVLLTGESGSGKELIARAIHYNGPRRARPLLVVDCSSLSEHLLESELFGHRRGAFTGASADKIGAFEEADGGTLFLDEISDASKPLQQKLRRVLQEGEIRRVGENVSRKVDVRVICATNRDLAGLVEKGEFMRDLYFRINKFPIHIPPLRSRLEDIPLLVDHFLGKDAEESGAPARAIHPAALELLMKRAWSENNVRELRNTVELAVDFAPDGVISPAILERVFQVQRGDIPAPAAGPGVTSRVPAGPAVEDGDGALVRIDRASFQGILEEARGAAEPDAVPKEKTPFYRIQLEVAAQAITEGLRAAGWKLRPAARLLGISSTKLRYELKEFLEQALVRSGGRLDEAARALEIPMEVLERKASDFGLDDIVERTRS
jgi:transcriptional regulator with GAF, ATPase, and Fis domain